MRYMQTFKKGTASYTFMIVRMYQQFFILPKRKNIPESMGHKIHSLICLSKSLLR